eukprot:CAMPEP_0119151542 /NCGR_PEP_ID=MMETSP1310-20130426/46468_1 /TAXON_ID=464262 /ORGANISM="Genus nov. species nov., Strain RCC2339" /LENGTH=841 /DNA_ID=CAMNT_0007143821 /DNA_START=103 /DNA_END=2628 /DNA_ORIENTATION=-
MTTKARGKTNVLELEIERARLLRDWNLLVSLRERYEKVSKESGGNLGDVLQGEILLFYHNNPEAALASFEKALGQSPNLREVKAYVGISLHRMGQHSKAQTHLEEFASKLAWDSNTSARQVQLYVLALSVLAGVYQANGNGSAESKTWEKIILIGKDNIDIVGTDEATLQLVSRGLVRVPQILAQDGDIPNAVRTFRSHMQTSSLPRSKTCRRDIMMALADVLLYETSQEQYPPMERKRHDDWPNGRKKLVPANFWDDTLQCYLVAELLCTSSDISDGQSGSTGSATRASFEPTPDDNDRGRSSSMRGGKVELAQVQGEVEHQAELTNIRKGIVLCAARIQGYNGAVEALERQLATKQDYATWLRYGLSLACAEQHERSINALKEAARYCEGDVPSCESLEQHALPCMMAAKICSNSIHGAESDAIVLATKALKIMERIQKEGSSNRTSIFLTWESKAHECIGLAFARLAEREDATKQKRENQLRALEALHNAVHTNTHNESALRQLGLLYADIRDLPKARLYLGLSLARNPCNEESWIAQALIFSAQQKFNESLLACEAGLRNFPASVRLTRIKGKLLLARDDYEEALATYMTAAKLWKESNMHSFAGRDADDIDVRSAEDMFIRSDVVSPDRSSVASPSERRRSRKVTALDIQNEVKHDPVGSLLSGPPAGVFEFLHLEECIGVDEEIKIDLWCDVAEVFLCEGDISKARRCLLEARKICAFSPVLLLLEAQIEAESGKAAEDLLAIYGKVINVDATNAEAKIRAARVHLQLGNAKVAESYYTSVVRRDKTSHKAWFGLGETFSHQNEVAKAAECMKTSLQLEATSPVMPFSIVGRGID